MSGNNININVPAAPTVDPAGNTAVDAYQRAVGATPTGFTENPIGAMAQAMDKIGSSVAGVFSRGTGSATGTVSADLQSAEANLVAADKASAANPSSIGATQNRLTAALGLYDQMRSSGFAANDPRLVRVATLASQLANQLGAKNIPFNAKGIDVRSLLDAVAQTVGKFGDAAGMQSAFSLAAILKASLGTSAQNAVELRDELTTKYQLSQQAAKSLANNWRVEVAADNELPSLDIATHTMTLSSTQEQASLAVLARAYWADATGMNAGDKDGFIKAFLGIANSGAFTPLTRKYNQARALARHQLGRSPQMQAIGAVTGAPVTAVNSSPQDDEQNESSDMFSALAVFHQQDPDAALPPALAQPLSGFFAT